MQRRDNPLSSEPGDQQPLHPKGIREHTDGREFRPFALLAVIIGVSAIIALICYVLQVYFIGPS
jgi:hypothetical protein